MTTAMLLPMLAFGTMLVVLYFVGFGVRAAERANDEETPTYVKPADLGEASTNSVSSMQ